MIRPVAADGRIETGGAFTPIHRPRVVERIESAAMQRIVLIVAPAGYGKSVALHQYLDTIKDPHVRYDVRPENASLLGFVRGLSDALLDVAPDARKTVSGAYEKSRSSKTPALDLAMWMHAHIKTFTGVIALDDLHVTENDPDISRFLVELIQRTKGRSRWIIASRSSLDLPVGSWLAYGEMDLNIDEQDLRFTVEEARLTARASRVGVRDEELQEILAMTEGWPTALSFALRTSTRSVDLRNIAASTREMVYRYLAEQVYESLQEDERELLHLIAFLPEIDLDVLRRAGYVKAKALVEDLRDRVAFIYPDRPNVYRCHDLFRDFLKHQVELEGDVIAEQVQKRASQALEQQGQLALALQAYTNAGAEDDMVRLLESHGFELLEQAHGDTVAEALDALSQEARAVNPLVLGLRAVREADRGRFDRAESLLERAIQRAVDPVVAARLSLRLALLLFNQRRDVMHILEPLVPQELPSDIRASAVSLLAPAYAAANRRDEAMAAIEQAEYYTGTVEPDELRARIYHRIGMAGFTLALPYERVARSFNQAQALALEGGYYTVAAVALGGLDTVALFYEDDATKSLWYAQQALNTALKAGDRYSTQTALLQIILVEAQRGNLERLRQLEQQFVAATTTDSTRSMLFVPTRSMMAAWEGHFEEAYRLLSGVAEREFVVFASDRIHNEALLALYAVASDRRERALEIVTRTLQDFQAQKFSYAYAKRVAEMARLVCAVVEALCGRATGANRILQKRSDIDSPAVGAMRDVVTAICHVIRNAALSEEVNDALSQLHAVGHGGLGKIIGAAFDKVVVSRRAQQDLPLTRAELDVLEALASGRSPKDIALETGRSVYTIQAHVQNVIRKLGCSGRHEAMTVARKRGLI